MSDRTTAALNLSYVLHEPSDSPQVASFLRRIDSTTARCRGVARGLARLRDDQLAARTVMRVRESTLPTVAAETNRLISVHVGAWELVARSTQLWLRERLLGWLDGPPHFLDGVDGDTWTSVPFFGARARLRLPVDLLEPDDNVAWWFATLVCRPRFASLHLDLTRLEARAGETSQFSMVDSAVALAEAAVRMHVEQWACPRALWAEPAERALNEFQQPHRRMPPCGHSEP